MDREMLKGFGLTDEQAEKVMEKLNGAFVPKSRFDEANEERKRLKAGVDERDRQLEGLKKESGAAEELKKQIDGLQAANAKMGEAHAAELKKLRREALDERLLVGAKAINPLAVRPFLAEIDAGVDDEGHIALRKQHIEALAKAESTKFLFKTEQGAGLVGVKPGESGDGMPPDVNPFDPKTFDMESQAKLYRENQELARALAKQAGVKYL